MIQRNELTRSAFSRFVEFHTVREIIILLIPDTAIIKKIKQIKFKPHEKNKEKRTSSG